MKQKRTLASFLGEMYRAFDYFNEKFAGGKLVRPVINVVSAPRKLEPGWFEEKGWKDGKVDVPEISLSAQQLTSDPEEVLHTLLHQMAHLKNAMNGIKDHTITEYHNKAYKASAETFGLKVEKQGYRGYAKTELDKTAKEAIRDLRPNREVFAIHKKIENNEEGRYMPLIVNRSKTMEKMLTSLSKEYGTRREAVESAVASLYKRTARKRQKA